MALKKCTICGTEYFPTSNRQFRCPDCKSHRMSKCICNHCGKEFIGPRGQNKHRLCPECFPDWQRQQKTNIVTKWNLESLKQATGRNAEYLRSIHESAKAAQSKSPLNGPLETNLHAKIWYLRTPTGQELIVRNLAKFLRENPDSFPSMRCARNAFMRMSRTIQGTEHRRPTHQYLGWSMTIAPDIPEDSAEHLTVCAELRVRREQIERAKRAKRKIKPKTKNNIKG